MPAQIEISAKMRTVRIPKTVFEVKSATCLEELRAREVRVFPCVPWFGVLFDHGTHGKDTEHNQETTIPNRGPASIKPTIVFASSIPPLRISSKACGNVRC